MHQEDGVQLRDSLHALAQSPFIACREFVDSARAHERLEPDHSAVRQLGESIEVARHEPAPKPEVDQRRAPGGFELEVEGGAVRGDGQVVQRHVDEGRVAACRESRGAVGDRLPLRAARLIEVDVRVDPAGEDMEAGGVDLLRPDSQVGTDLAYATACHRDVGDDNRGARYDGPPRTTRSLKAGPPGAPGTAPG